MSVLQQEMGKGGLAVSNIKLYYCAAHLATITQWWIPNSRINWLGEQIGIPMPLLEWMFYLLNKVRRIDVIIRLRVSIFTVH